MDEYKVEHVAYPADYKRLYNMLDKMDQYMMPPLSQRVRLEEYAQKLIEKAEIFYIVNEGKDCGHCAIYMNDISKAFITSFGILPEFQRMGLGNELIQRVISYVKLRSMKQIGLEVHRDNIAAYRLYFKSGFRQIAETGEIKNMIMYLHGDQKGEERMQRIEISRTALCITQKCTLRCKLCLAFIPYYKDPRDTTLEEAKKVIKSYFQVVDTVKTFTVTGGEPIVNKDLDGILAELYSYKDQITGSIDFVTNGTLDIPSNVLDRFEKHSNCTRVILSDYGEDLSSKINSIVNDSNFPHRFRE